MSSEQRECAIGMNRVFQRPSAMCRVRKQVVEKGVLPVKGLVVWPSWGEVFT